MRQGPVELCRGDAELEAVYSGRLTRANPSALDASLIRDSVSRHIIHVLFWFLLPSQDIPHSAQIMGLLLLESRAQDVYSYRVHARVSAVRGVPPAALVLFSTLHWEWTVFKLPGSRQWCYCPTGTTSTLYFRLIFVRDCRLANLRTTRSLPAISVFSLYE